MDQRELDLAADYARHSAEVARLKARVEQADNRRYAAWFGCILGAAALMGLVSGNPEMKPYAAVFLITGICGVIWLLIDRKSAAEEVAALARATQYRDNAAQSLKVRANST
ncbi:hypothetical protein B5U98_29330 [Bosea sp. Tri-39]|nr:hypothetical protein BLM15_20065 [Bosea sp. Tri-49]RXT16111.1 hypothetical protein B5U98_29330 [Bosea sp. Tri-39]RXT39803.1 hypothetical protein B5U99_06375 [Bosea sp. Tri-54]